jgi:hypothetical protein
MMRTIATIFEEREKILSDLKLFFDPSGEQVQHMFRVRLS